MKKNIITNKKKFTKNQWKPMIWVQAEMKKNIYLNKKDKDNNNKNNNINKINNLKKITKMIMITITKV